MSENVKESRTLSIEQLKKRALELQDHYKSENTLLSFEKENAVLVADIEEAKYKEMLYKVKSAELYSQMQEIQKENTKTVDKDAK